MTILSHSLRGRMLKIIGWNQTHFDSSGGIDIERLSMLLELAAYIKSLVAIRPINIFCVRDFLSIDNC
jgi:hypothetical protein